MSKALLFGLLISGAGPSKDDWTRFDQWDCWSTFGEGSWVRMELQGGPKKTTVTSIRKKTPDRLDLEIVREGGGGVETRRIEKLMRAEQPVPCDRCKERHKGVEAKETGREKVPVGDKEIDCVVVEVTMYGCKGGVEARFKNWHSKDVPGWFVRGEGQIGPQSFKTVCSGFQAK